MLNLPHIPTDSPSQPKSLTFASGILSLFEQIKQNPSDPLFSIASTEKEIRVSYYTRSILFCVIIIWWFFLLICSVKYKIVCLSKFKMNRLGSIYYRLNISLKKLNIELILHTRMILTGRMHIVFYKTK